MLLHNKGRQTEPALFKAASEWMLASRQDRMGLARELFASLGLSECAMKVLNDCADADLLISKVNTEVRRQARHLLFDCTCFLALAMVNLFRSYSNDKGVLRSTTCSHAGASGH